MSRCWGTGLGPNPWLGCLALDRPTPTLSTGEARRLRLLSLALGDLRGLVVEVPPNRAPLSHHGRV